VAVYGDRAKYEANQGDLFRRAPLEGPWVKRATVMLISHDCDCDKYIKPNTPLTEDEKEQWRVTVAEAHPISLLPASRAKAAREDKMARYFFLPSEGELQDTVVDLWTMQPIRFRSLLECKRVASLSPEWREKLWWKIIRLRLGEHFKAILEGKVPDDAA